MTIVELRDKRAALWKSMETFLDTRRDANGCLSAEDDASYAKMEADMNALTNEIARSERREQMDAEMSKATARPITEPIAKEARKTGRASAEYRADFLNMVRGHRTVYNVMEEGTSSAGGYLCPTEFENQIITDLISESTMRQLCKNITTSNERKIPVAATHTAATWTAESAGFTESNPTFSQKSIDAYKLTDLIKVSVELLEDSMFDLEAYLSKEIAAAFANAEEAAFCTGNGTGKPTGLFTANGGSVGVTSASATAITTDEILSLIYGLKPQYRKNAKFLMNDATVALIRKLKDGNNNYMWQPAVTGGQPDKLFGYDLYTSSQVPTVAASAYTIAFGDFSNYWIANRSGMTLQRLNELYSTNGQVGFTAMERVDGKIILAEGIKLLQQHA